MYRVSNQLIESSPIGAMTASEIVGKLSFSEKTIDRTQNGQSDSNISSNSVKALLESLNPSQELYVENAKRAVKCFDSLSSEGKAELFNSPLLKFRYLDAREAVKLDEARLAATVVINSLLGLDLNSETYDVDSIKTLESYRNLSSFSTFMVIMDKAANLKLDEAKASQVIKSLVTLSMTDKNYLKMALVTLEDNKNLSNYAKELVLNNLGAKLKLQEANAFVTTSLLESLDSSCESYLADARKSLDRYNELSDEEKTMIHQSEHAKMKLDEAINKFDELNSKEVIDKLKLLYKLSSEDQLTFEYFSHALEAITEYELLSPGARSFVEVNAAKELLIAQNGKVAHPIAYLLEGKLPESTEDKNYYEIADILVAAYDVVLNDEQKALINKCPLTATILDEASARLNEHYDNLYGVSAV